MLYKEKWFSFFFAFDIRPFIICITLFFFSTYLEVIKVFYFQHNNGLIASSDYKHTVYLVWKNLYRRWKETQWSVIYPLKVIIVNPLMHMYLFRITLHSLLCNLIFSHFTTYYGLFMLIESNIFFLSRLPRWLSDKEFACQCRRCRRHGFFLTPGSGRSPGERNGNPLQYSCLVNLMDRGTSWTAVHGVAKESDMA